jgi:hypothetical protein
MSIFGIFLIFDFGAIHARLMCAHQDLDFWDFLIFDFGAIHAGLMCAGSPVS